MSSHGFHHPCRLPPPSGRITGEPSNDAALVGTHRGILQVPLSGSSCQASSAPLESVDAVWVPRFSARSPFRVEQLDGRSILAYVVTEE